jgi:hypothetical protein
MNPAYLQFILLALQAAPALVDSGKELLSALEGDLSFEQRAALRAAQEAAHASLQAAVAVAVAEEAAAPEAPAKGE